MVVDPLRDTFSEVDCPFKRVQKLIIYYLQILQENEKLFIDFPEKKRLSSFSEKSTNNFTVPLNATFLLYVLTSLDGWHRGRWPSPRPPCDHVTLIQKISGIFIWRGTTGDEVDIPATELPLTYRITTLSFRSIAVAPDAMCRAFF